MPAGEFPTVDEINAQQTLKVAHKDFKHLLDKTHFSMAQQDVRYYLNGLLLETSAKVLRTVATDGHRLAMAEIELPEGGKAGQQVIIPRKGVLELQRILGPSDEMLEISVGSNHVRVAIGDVRFTSKLIDGRFPEYGRVIPDKPPRVVSAVREDLRHALQRAAILSNEKYRGIRFALKPNTLVIQSHNPEQEEAEEELEVGYDGEELEIGFNVNYLLDALAAIDAQDVQIGLTDGNSSCLIRAAADSSAELRRDADEALGLVIAGWPWSG